MAVNFKQNIYFKTVDKSWSEIHQDCFSDNKFLITSFINKKGPINWNFEKRPSLFFDQHKFQLLLWSQYLWKRCGLNVCINRNFPKFNVSYFSFNDTPQEQKSKGTLVKTAFWRLYSLMRYMHVQIIEKYPGSNLFCLRIFVRTNRGDSICEVSQEMHAHHEVIRVTDIRNVITKLTFRIKSY